VENNQLPNGVTPSAIAAELARQARELTLEQVCNALHHAIADVRAKRVDKATFRAQLAELAVRLT
jgi:hypothetical protein